MLWGLIWLAQTCDRIQLRHIQIANMQPTWLPTLNQQRHYRQWVSLCGGTCFGLIVGLMGGISFGLVGTLREGLVHGICGGLIGGTLSGLVIGYVSREIETLEFGPLGSLNWIQTPPVFYLSWKRLYRDVRRRLLRRLIFGLLIGLFLGLGQHPLQLLLFAGLGALLFGVLAHLFEAPQKRSGCSMPIPIVVLLGTVCSVGIVALVLLAFQRPIPQHLVLIGLPISLYLWFFSGGLIYLQRFILRCLLWRTGIVPWSLTTFLNRATTAGLLQRRGNGYRFIHPALQRYLAQVSVDSRISND